MTYNNTWSGAGATWQPAGDFVLDWDVTGADGSANLGSATGTATVGVSVSTPSNGDCDAFSLRDGLLYSNDVTRPTISEITFDQPVSDVNFQLIDVDQGCRWDDQVTVLAYDADGNLVEVDFAAIAGAQTVSGNTIEGEAGLRDTGITVSVDGPIIKLVIMHDNGPDAAMSGHVKVTDLGFNCAPQPERDGIVEGTEHDDVIDLAYTGDPDGDRVDAGDAVAAGAAPHDDLIAAGGGNDLVRAGQGADEVSGGDGCDTLFGEADDDVLRGDEGDDVLYGGAGHDALFGGSGDDILSGGNGEDFLDGGEGADVLSGGADRDWIAGVNAGDEVDGGAEGDDWDTLDLTGSAVPGGSLSIHYTTPDQENGVVVYKDAAGEETGTLTFRDIETIVPCFTPGTMIATPKGEVPVERLRVGDRVITRDNGIREIKWVGSRSFSFKDLARSHHLAPIRIAAGALGHGLPERDMLLSPNHRVLVANDRTSLYFDEREVLAAAKHLVNSRDITVVEPMAVSYIHFMCESHEVVLSDGAWTESFQPGDHSLNGVGNAQRQELFEIFPELATREGLNDYAAARRILKKHEAQVLLRS